MLFKVYESSDSFMRFYVDVCILKICKRILNNFFHTMLRLYVKVQSFALYLLSKFGYHSLNIYCINIYKESKFKKKYYDVQSNF